MENLPIGIASVVSVLVLLIFGLHIGVALALVGFIGLIIVMGFYPAVITVTSAFYFKIGDYNFVTAPLFVLMGFLAAGGGMSGRLYDTALLWVGKVRGSLGIATVIGCTGFGAVCGSSLVTATVFAKVSAPEMRARGYDKKFAYGVCAAAGMIGMLVPPSVFMVVYGILSGESIGKLLFAGAVPGLLLAVTFSIGILLLAKIKPDWIPPAIQTKVTWGQRLVALKSIWPVLIVAFIIFGGMFGGVFNATEAASVAAFTMVILLVVIKPRTFRTEMANAFAETAKVTAMIFLVIAGAYIFSHLLVITGSSTAIANLILQSDIGIMGIIISIVLMYLMLGCFLDGISMICVTVPLLHPVLVSLGVDGVWYGIVAVLAIEIGVLTPPVGVDVYGAQSVAEPDVSIDDVFLGSTPFFFLALLVLAIVIAFPGISTFLPNFIIT